VKHFKVYWLTCICSMLFAAVASATTIVMPSDEALIAKSPLIVEGTVVRTGPVAIDSRIWTETVVSVERTLKGSAGATVTIREIGGELDGRITKIFGSPQYGQGEAVLVFLTPTPRGDYQTTDLFVGKFSADATLDGRAMWVRDDATDHVQLLDAHFQPIANGNVQRDAAAFESFIVQRAAGRTAVPNTYGMQNPVLKSIVDRAIAPGRRATDFYTLIDPPTVYRWFNFDTGGSVNWYSYGTQPGYTGGGLNEIKTAMSSWNSYTGASIKYNYVGTETTFGGVQTSPNGVNEVLFNDPHADISGSWNPSTGGVVGLGGFNGTSAGQKSWSHGTAYAITEANLAIQDGVSPSAGIPSNELAEIVAHEFGHTLGFGHSADSTALMYYMVTGLGPSLRADDEAAATYLYPGTGSTPPPPPAGTAPTSPANVSVSNIGQTTVTVNWTDTATNETAQQLWLAVANGGYSKIGDLAANATSTNVNGLAAGTSYRIYVTASNAYGTSAPSNVASFNTPAGTPAPSAPVASFNANTTSGVANQTTFTFTSTSIGTITSYLWTFGDGSTAGGSSASHVYAGAGAFTVTLQVTNSAGSSSASRGISVTAPVPATPPVNAAFSVNPASPVATQNVTFSDASTGSPASWLWSFGDGSSSTQQNPTHAYANAGTYSVALQVFNSVSSSTKTQTIVVAPNVQTSHTLVSAAAQTSGLNGSQWRTELTLFNASYNPVSVTLTYVPSYGSGPQQRATSLGGRQSVTYANALVDLYGISSGTGAIAIDSSSTSGAPNVLVTSRTFTDSSSGTYGQSVPSLGTSDFASTMYLTGMAVNAAYRTNLGVVNRSSSNVPMTLSLFDANGAQVATANITVPANNFQQAGLASFFPAIGTTSYNALSLRASGGSSDAVSIYASVVDNRTQDPVYIQATPGSFASPMILPAVGRAPGVNGTFWRSDVTIFNPTTRTMSIGVRYFAAAADNRFAPATTYFVGPNQTLTLDDVVGRFGVTSGSGSLELAWSGSTAPVVTSRTYTPSSNGGTFGQSIDPADSFGSDSYVTGLRSDASFRSNVGFVNNGDQTIGINVTLIASSGNAVASGIITVPAKSVGQWSIGSLFPNVNVAALGSFTLQAHTDTAPTLFAYGSIVDNTSGDPVYFPGQ
jgi:PKD repeat protein